MSELFRPYRITQPPIAELPVIPEPLRARLKRYAKTPSMRRVVSIVGGCGVVLALIGITIAFGLIVMSSDPSMAGKRDPLTLFVALMLGLVVDAVLGGIALAVAMVSSAIREKLS